MRRDAVTVLVAALLALIVVSALGAPRDGIAWEAGNLAGLLAAILYVVLCAWPVRPRAPPAARPMPLLGHRNLGIVALVALVVHVAVLLVREPLLVEHLKVTAPGYMLAGIAAAVLFLFLAIAGAWPVRRRYRTPARFQAWHLGVALLGLAVLAVHVLGNARYAGSRLAMGGWVLALVLAALLMLRPRRHGRAAEPAAAGLARTAADSVCPRYGGRLVALALLAVALTAALLALPVRDLARRTVHERVAGLPVVFPHERHRAVNCVRCHHNFTDHTGAATCVVCHRAHDPAIKLAAEPRFHGFCESCHAERTGADGHRGPVRGCAACHDPLEGGGARG